MSAFAPRWGGLPVAAALSIASTATVVLGASASPARAAVDPADFQQVTLAKGVAEVGEPMSLAVLPDRSVVHTSRDGRVWYTDAAGNTKSAGKLDVYSHDEEGLQGVQVDPDFAANRWLYLFYAPPLSTPAGDAPNTGTAADFAPFDGYNQLSRFKLRSDNTLDQTSEQQILRVGTSRGICCHVGGDLDFDRAGNLYLTTGDDSNPFASDGYSPLDERADRNPAYDAQRTSANSNDLRGKILRIKVNDDGSYAIPAGNLFTPGTPGTRPEIYAMGFRNPFRMAVDKPTGIVYLGDYGPDAGSTDANRGPGGQVEFDRVTGPGFYGWPYCTGSNTTAESYNHYDFATGTSGAKYDCANGPRNTSRHNTGVSDLPAAKPSWIKYGDAGSRPEMGPGGSESPMGGPVYHYDADNPSTTKFPQSLDGHVFLGEFGRGWIKEATVAGDGSAGAIGDFPFAGKQVMDLAFGPEGSLYVLDYGTGYFGGDQNSALYRIDYIGGANRAPTVSAGADRTSGPTPLTVNFTSTASDPDGDPLSYSWVFGDGGTATGAGASHTYTTDGQYTATVTVDDGHGNTATADVVVTVGNTAPTVTLDPPHDGQLFSFGDAVSYRVAVSDPEDGTIDCTAVTVTYILGHDSHGHPQTEALGCSGTIQTLVDGEHAADANVFGVLDAEYTDKGGLTTHDRRILQPRHRQAEHFTTSSGVQVVDHAGANGARTVGYIDNGDWIEFDPYALADAVRFTARVSSAGAGGTIEVRSGSATGTLLGSVAVPVTGGWETFQDVSTDLSGQPSGTTKLYLVFTGGAGALFDLDDFTFGTGTGTSARTYTLP
ncbi:carbohydrate-binding protein [Planosporangium mesophilum]|uniref:Glycosyl hydrolase n=1 Tax=Planosporangium mesophilum TaxID=689768 RepID=A0A8J3TDF8_9ACTN|nr:carbohydrate-binding protein [Planosporangium mesophilum]NJC84296.1 carbohydrate-binding protein [Planosporangium mesophilum]GII23142.1 glycosyl hydrolase [Planosporangium mesophilum]